MRLILLSLFLLLTALPALAWDGRDVGNDASVSLEDEDVNVGEVVELHDEDEDAYTDVEIKDIQKNDDGSAFVKVYDSSNGQIRNLQMEAK